MLVAPLLLEFGWGEIAQRGMDTRMHLHVYGLILRELSYVSSFWGSLHTAQRLGVDVAASRHIIRVEPSRASYIVLLFGI